MLADKILRNYDKTAFKTNLIEWYEKNRRNLPWRKTKDPYKIWVSEIMLQQTKVDTVIDYYKKFIKKYPTVEALAQADEQEVLKMWEGLGYYSRARNLHTAAKEVVATYDGIIPNEPTLLGELKGIGPYTKGAIASIAFDLPEPAVDGNVMRVLSRTLLLQDNISEAKTRKRMENIVRDLISIHNPSAFNQGLMELGALICTPRSPACMICPVQTECRAFFEGMQHQLPVKLKKKKQRVEPYIVLLLKNHEGKIAIEQRPNEGLLANMWQFPMIKKDLIKDDVIKESVETTYDISYTNMRKVGKLRHIFSHIIWELDVYEADSNDQIARDLQFVSVNSLTSYPFSVSHIKIRDEILNVEKE